jgi:hypothetical protein
MEHRHSRQYLENSTNACCIAVEIKIGKEKRDGQEDCVDREAFSGHQEKRITGSDLSLSSGVTQVTSFEPVRTSETHLTTLSTVLDIRHHAV